MPTSAIPGPEKSSSCKSWNPPNPGVRKETYREATVSQGPVAFGFPEAYRVEIADDPAFDDATTVVAVTSEGDPAAKDAAATDAEVSDTASPGREPVVHETGAVSARYVRVTATDLRAYAGGSERLREERRTWAVFAIAALAVRDPDGTDLAATDDADVTASSSIESERWGRDRLVDGEYEATVTSTSPLLRTEVTLSKPVASARAHVAGLGYGELHVNGEKVGDAVLDPGWTEYDERVLYSTHEVGDLLSEGENAVGLWLGRGWFSKACRQWPRGGSPRARLRLAVEYEDGSTREISTGGDWTATESPIVENDIYHGETYDARREWDGWPHPGFDDADWTVRRSSTVPTVTCLPSGRTPSR